MRSFGEAVAGGIEITLRLEGVPKEQAQRVTIVVFASGRDARAAFEAAPVKQQRTGANVTEVDGLGDRAAVATIATEGARGTAYVLLDNLLIESVSEIEVANAEAAGQNAIDLGRYGVEFVKATRQRAEG